MTQLFDSAPFFANPALIFECGFIGLFVCLFLVAIIATVFEHFAKYRPARRLDMIRAEREARLSRLSASRVSRRNRFGV